VTEGTSALTPTPPERLPPSDVAAVTGDELEGGDLDHEENLDPEL